MRTYYKADDKKEMASTEMLADLYGIKPSEVNCRDCQFMNLHTADFDRKQGRCTYWNSIVPWCSFCTHFMIRQKIKKGGRS